MNRRHFSKALLVGSMNLPLASRASTPGIAAEATTPSLKLAAVSRSIDINGRAATVFGLITPDGKLGMNLTATVIRSRARAKRQW